MVIRNKDITKIIIPKKYLLMSFISALILLRDNLFEYIWLGLEWDSKLLTANLINVITFITRKPELVEKKDPPKITKRRKTTTRFLGIFWNEMPILDTLLQIETSIFKKLLS